MKLWFAAASDIPWLTALAKECYGDRIEDDNGVREWLKASVNNPDFFIARGEYAAVVVYIFRYFYAPSRPEATLIFLLGSRQERSTVWEAAQLLEHAVLWAKEKRSVVFKMDSATAFDIAPLAKRIGAKPTGQTYVVEFGNES